MPFLQILILWFVLVGCQVIPPEAALESVTVPPIRTMPSIPDEKPEVNTVLNTPVVPVTQSPIPTQVTSTPSSTRDLPTLSPTTMLPTATSTIEPSPTTFRANGFLLYGITNIDGENQIYALQPSGESRFVTTGQMLTGQAFSPEGTKILVDTSDWSNPPLAADKVFVFDLETGETTPLNLLAHPRDGVFWARDGNALLYIARYSADDTDQLVLYDIASGENQVLVEMNGILFTAGWAVDEQTIAYVAEVSEQYDLFTVNSNTLEKQQITNDSEIETMALWSPNSSQLLIGTTLDERSAFELWPWGVEHLYLLDINADTKQLIVDKWLGSESVSWSPDGQQIAFSSGLLCTKNLGTMMESCPLENVAPYNEYFASFWEPPVWSADGTWLAFRAYNETCDMVYFLELISNTVIPGDLNCDVILESPIAPMYWLSANLPVPP